MCEKLGLRQKQEETKTRRRRKVDKNDIKTSEVQASY